MGQQQLLLIVLGVIIVGVAIVAGIGMFNAGAEESCKDELVSQSMAIAANAQQFYKKPLAMGGGGNSFANYVLPPKMSYTANGSYSANVGNTQEAVITATPNAPLNYTWTVTAHVNADSMWTVVQ
jgi:hypothetical protein